MARQLVMQAKQIAPTDPTVLGAQEWLAQQEHMRNAATAPLASVAVAPAPSQPVAVAPAPSQPVAVAPAPSQPVAVAPAPMQADRSPDVDFLLGSVFSKPAFAAEGSAPPAASKSEASSEDEDESEPEADEEETTSPKSKQTTLVLGVMMLLTISFIGMIVYMVLNSTFGVADMPPPNNSKQIDIGDTAKSMEAAKAFGLTGSGFYVTSEKPDALKSFYTSAMTDKGWKKGAGTNSVQFTPSGLTGLPRSTTLTFQKDTTKVSSIMISGPLSDDDVRNVSSGPFNGRVKAGDTIVILFELDLSKLKKALSS
jgi:hypothetical protein